MEINNTYQIENLEYTINNITSIFDKDKRQLPLFKVIIEARSYKNEFNKEMSISLTYTYPYLYPNMFIYDCEMVNKSYLKTIFDFSKDYSGLFKKRYKDILEKQFINIIEKFYKEYTKEYLIKNNYDDLDKMTLKLLYLRENSELLRENSELHKFLAIKFSQKFGGIFRDFTKNELDHTLERFNL